MSHVFTAACLSEMRPRRRAVRNKRLRLWLWVVHPCVSVLCQAHCSAGYRALQDTYLMRRLWLCNCRLFSELLWEMYFKGAKAAITATKTGPFVWSLSPTQQHWSQRCYTADWIMERVISRLWVFLTLRTDYSSLKACSAFLLLGRVLSEGFFIHGIYSLVLKSNLVIIHEAVLLSV